jgi:hypothetical protein
MSRTRVLELSCNLIHNILALDASLRAEMVSIHGMMATSYPSKMASISLVNTGTKDHLKFKIESVRQKGGGLFLQTEVF